MHSEARQPNEKRQLLLVEQVRPDGKKTPTIPLQVQEDLLVRHVIASLVARWQLPTQNQQGAPLTYQLSLGEEGRVLPEDQRLMDLHLPPGRNVRLEETTLYPGTSVTHPLVPPTFSHTASIHDPVRRRHVLHATGHILLACSLTGLLSGVSTAWAQYQWGPHTSLLQRPPAPTHPAVMNARPFAPLLRFTAHQATVRTLAWSPQGTTLSSGGDDATVLLWTPDGTVQQQGTFLDAVQALAWSPEGNRVAAGVGTAVAFIQTATGHVLAFPQVHHAPVTSVVWSSRPGHPVVSGSRDHQAIIWQTQEYHPQRSFLKHTAPIEALSITSDGSTVASASQGGLIRVWAIDTVQEIHGAYQDAPIAMQAAAFSPDGATLAVGGSDGIVRIWTQSLRCQHTQTTGNEPRCLDRPVHLHAHIGAVRTLAFSPDGSTLATGGDDTQVVLWDVPNGSNSSNGFQPRQHLAHTAPVLALAWSPQTSQMPRLATAAGTLVQLWASA
ncbi:WD40 repeat domain-containing protein [Dictyobacter arantiisoli]|uniref:Uncharacterized protein n=1 Tax=Dictyobacter arantiisoli TaxID=2014874 RepID=A0A5A5TK28_9CHLR|nr:WD40 repeat domain-containing protein [Dictyobacter arantiisoli]GCF11244.1 hypothetical protein KDI_48080 [Dictyobacter arantiisoli]